MKKTEDLRHYTELTYRENRERLSLLLHFKELVSTYFDNSRLNLMDGTYIEEPQASEAREAINALMQQVYAVMRLADIKTAATSTPSISISGNAQNIDLILNMFNLGRNDIPPNAVIDFLDRAVDVYQSNRLPSFVRTINPIFWVSVLLKHIAGENRKKVQP